MQGFGKVFQRLFVLLIFLAGCASMLPSIESRHPVGYKKLIEAQTVCAEKDLKHITHAYRPQIYCERIASTSHSKVPCRLGRGGFRHGGKIAQCRGDDDAR